MITGLIRWSARNVFLVALATVFVTLAGIYAVSRVPLDAIPDLSDVQVIVYTEYPGQAPQVVEDQVTYPLTTAMLSGPKSRVVRGFSFFGVSMPPVSDGSINMSCAARRRTLPNFEPFKTGTSATASPRPKGSPKSRALAGSSSNTAWSSIRADSSRWVFRSPK